MAKSEILYIPSRYDAFGANFTNADGTTIKTLYSVPADDANLLQLIITSTDTVAADLLFYVSIGGLDYCIGHIDIPANAGTNGTAIAIDGLSSNSSLQSLVDDTTINRYLPLKGGTIVKAGMLSAVSAAKTISIYGVVGDYSI